MLSVAHRTTASASEEEATSLHRSDDSADSQDLGSRRVQAVCCLEAAREEALVHSLQYSTQ